MVTTSTERAAKCRAKKREMPDGLQELRARNRNHNASLRAKKKDVVQQLQIEIDFYKSKLNISTSAAKENSHLKPKPKNIYLPPNDEANHMTKHELSAWRKEQQKRLRVLNKIYAERGKLRVVSMKNELMLLKEAYKFQEEKRTRAFMDSFFEPIPLSEIKLSDSDWNNFAGLHL